MRTKFKKWALPFLKEHPDIAYPNCIEDKIFFAKPFYLEIGGGKGDFIIALAKKNPKRHYLMIERVISVAGPAVKKIIENKIKNVRVLYNNFAIISKDIKKESVKEIYLNFSDPWPKKKHAKRRLTSPLFMDEYYRILIKKGKIIFKTDQENLYLYTKKVLDNKKFTIKLDNPNYNKLDKTDALTEYESKFRGENKKIYRLIIAKL